MKMMTFENSIGRPDVGRLLVDDISKAAARSQTSVLERQFLLRKAAIALRILELELMDSDNDASAIEAATLADCLFKVSDLTDQIPDDIFKTLLLDVGTVVEAYLSFESYGRADDS
jgi:hypothetical protein